MVFKKKKKELSAPPLPEQETETMEVTNEETDEKPAAEQKITKRALAAAKSFQSNYSGLFQGGLEATMCDLLMGVYQELRETNSVMRQLLEEAQKENEAG